MTRGRSGRATVAVATVLVALVVLAVGGCGQREDRVGDDAGPDLDAVTGEVVVSAASSLTAAFDVIADEFTAANPGVTVTLNLDGSSSLATQVLDGAPVDVVALADRTSMARLVDAGAVTMTPVRFAANDLVIVTQPSNPAGIGSLADLAGVGGAGVVALCAPEVPCGRYAAAALSSAGLTLDESRVTRTRNASATLAAVADGDAVAGIVYATDATTAAQRVAVVALPATVDVVATYPIATTAVSSNATGAQAFVDWVLSPRGQPVLAAAGFRPAPEGPWDG